MSSKIRFTSEGIVVDFSGAPNGREPLPEAMYDVFVSRVEQRTASTGNEMLVFTLEVESGDFIGRRLWENVVLVDQCLWKLQSIVDVLTGEPCSEGERLVQPEKLEGLRCTVLVSQVERGDKTYNDVVLWYPATTPPPVQPLTSPEPDWDDPF